VAGVALDELIVELVEDAGTSSSPESAGASTVRRTADESWLSLFPTPKLEGGSAATGRRFFGCRHRAVA